MVSPRRIRNHRSLTKPLFKTISKTMSQQDQYSKQRIAPLGGMANTPQPHAIRDEQASDMLNLRFHKLGYLVNRNGARAFVLDGGVDDIFSDIDGATAIGEFVLSAPVTDSIQFRPLGGEQVYTIQPSQAPYPLVEYDRLLIIGVRVNAGVTPDGVAPPDFGRGGLVYVGIPWNNIPDNHRSWQLTLSSLSDAVWYGNAETANGTPRPIFFKAPARRITRPTANDSWVALNGYVDDPNWIEHYQQMQQFAGALVIADRVNGDVILHDEWDEAEPGETKVHRLRLQENCKANFDVDIVKLDFKLGEDEINGEGVENGMGLYKFYGKEKKSVAVNDGYDNGTSDLVGDSMLSANRVSGLSVPGGIGAGFDLSGEIDKTLGGVKRFAKFWTMDIQGDDGTIEGAFKCCKIDKTQQFVYSNIKDQFTYSSLLDAVSFENPKVKPTYDDEGRKENNNAADYYEWEDVKLTYYPCTGVDGVTEMLTDKDREWSKTKPVPKVVKLPLKTGIEQEVALGVWAYRFVWDMGNGEYSAPSAPLLAPDMLWSAMKDSVKGEILVGSWERRASYAGNATQTGISGAGMTTGGLFIPGITEANTTVYDALFNKIKSSLYEVGHPFNTANRSLQQTLITLFHQGSEIELPCILAEAIGGKAIVDEGDNILNDDASIDSLTYTKYGVSKIVVPLTKRLGDYITLNSVFSDPDFSVKSGAYRKGYVGYTPLQYEFILKEYNMVKSYGMTMYRWSLAENAEQEPLYPYTTSSGDWMGVDDESEIEGFDEPIGIIKNGEASAYLNIIREFTADTNNTADTPCPTIARFVSKESDRLLNVGLKIPPEVKDRLLLSGYAELALVNSGDVGVLTSESHLTYYQLASISMDPFWSMQGRLAPSMPRTLVSNFSSSVWHRIIKPIDRVRYAYIIADMDSSDDIVWKAKYDVYKNDPPYNETIQNFTFNNVTVALYLPGERLLIPEQLTSYFPSSLLFNAPRVNLHIDADQIPRRAKKLRVYRTLASHDNQWQPTEFGLVEEVDIKREPNGTALPIDYFDDVKDVDLDFTDNPNQYDGLIRPLASRFVVPLYEKMYYLNYRMEYQPQAPRGFINNIGTVHPTALKQKASDTVSKVSVAKKLVVNNTPVNLAKGYRMDFAGKLLQYMIAFKDISGVVSPIKIDLVDFSADTGKLCAVAIILAGYPYSGGIKSFDVYRRELPLDFPYPPFIRIGEIKAEDEGIFIDTAEITDGEEWKFYDSADRGTPISPPLVEEYRDGVQPSQVQDPSWIKPEEAFRLRSGDGDNITGAWVSNSGNLVVFKESSIHRLGFAGRNQVERIDQVSSVFGCIAPNSIITYNGFVYFLSHEGLMRYNDNVFEKADGDFNYELKLRINDYIQTVRNPAVRDTAIAFNPVHNELWLNIPSFAKDKAWSVDDPGLKGHIYVLNLLTNMVTKFGYETGDDIIFHPGADPANPTTRGTWDRTAGRLYYTTSRDELVSADILPKNQHVDSLFYIEAPTDRHFDDVQRAINAQGLPETNKQIDQYDIQSWWRSKQFTGDDRTITKRVRKIFATFAKARNHSITLEVDNSTYVNGARSSGGYQAVGKKQFIPPHEVGKDRGESVTVELKSSGETEIRDVEFWWRPVNTFLR